MRCEIHLIKIGLRGMKFFSTARRAAQEYSGILTRLRRDASGNTLAMIAMATIPLAGMVGSAVDMGRSYMIKSRLQQACDAGVLAARRSMATNTLDTNSQTQGTKFFNINFATGTAGASNIGFTTTGNSEGLVTGTATARIPMTITKIFGTDYVDLSLTCEARLDINNTDVMFVLDTTGSMNDCPDNSACGGGAGSKIVGLRQAVIDFTSTLSGAAPPSARLRYGFVPYSSTVNVGALLPSNYINSNWNYQTRVANFNTPVYIGTAGSPTNTTETYGSNLSSSNCLKYGTNKSYPTLDGSTFNSGSAPSNTTQTVYSALDWGGSTNISGTGNKVCRRTKSVTVTTYVTKYSFSGFTYQQKAFDTSSFKTGSTITVATGSPNSTDYSDTSTSYDPVQLAALPTYTGSEESTSWTGCIEERDTVPNATFTYGSIPSNAYDLDIDTVPSGTSTNWRASWPQIIWDYNGGSPFAPWAYRTSGYWACPTAAQKLQVMTAAQVTSYVNTLTPIGGTYHDVGMIWGARLVSPTGIFGSENATAPNGQPISRNIVFMTDGQMAPNPNIYGLYGYEDLDQRVTGGTPNVSDLTNRHNSRFVAMCNAIRAKNVSIWVIGFGQTLNSQLTSCADPGQAFYASDTTTLRAQFVAIATKIAKLRLSK